ncbi:MAG: acyltransferase family protein [Planctomycetota bacterium]
MSLPRGHGGPVPIRGKRYHDLDLLRGLLMMGGVVVHTGTLAASETANRISWFSGQVRMEAFMVISGFLSLMMLQKYGTAVTSKRRLIAIGVPFVVTLLVINPPTLWLVYQFHNPGLWTDGYWSFLANLFDLGDRQGPVVWHLQLWFLIPLLVYVPLVLPIAKVVDGLSRASSHVPSWAWFTVAAAGLAAACLASRLVYEVAAESITPRPLRFVVRQTLYYLPFYAVGFVLFASPGMRTAFFRFRPLHLVAAGVWVWLATRYFDSLPKKPAEAVLLVGQAYFGFVLVSTLMWVFRRWFASGGQVSRFLSDSAYTVYLLHFIVIYGLATLVWDRMPDGNWRMIPIALATLAITLLLHAFVVSRVPMLRFLLNGRGKSGSKPATRSGSAVATGASAA